MAKKRKELQIVKEELVQTAKTIMDKAIPAATDGLNRLVSRLTTSIGETIQEEITKKLSTKKKKRSKAKKEEKNVDSQRSSN